jgi:thymidylate kinase
MLWRPAIRDDAEAWRREVGRNTGYTISDGALMADTRFVAAVADPRILGSSARSGTSGTRGHVLMIVGPDGTGKTTLCTALVKQIAQHSAVRVLANRHGAERPGLLPRRKSRGSPSEPHRHPAYPLLLSLAKVLYYVADFYLGWLVQVRPFVRRGGWVVVERGWWDVLVDPRRYRLSLPRWLCRSLAHVLPRPCLVLVLSAPTAVITARKAQLSDAELMRQMKMWHEILPPKQNRLYLDTSAPRQAVLSKASRAIADLGRVPATARREPDE